MTARDVARRVLERVEREAAWTSLALDGELARAGLAPRDRALATELVYGALRHQPRLDRALGAYAASLKKTPPMARTAMRLAAYQLLFMRVPSYAAVDDAVSAIRGALGAKVAGFANAVLRKVATQGEPPITETGAARVAVERSLPPWIVRELALVLPPEQVEPAAVGLTSAPSLAIRVDLRRATRDEVATELRAAGADVDVATATRAGLLVSGLGEPARVPSFVAGRWTVQDVGAQLVAERCEPAGAQLILDACAGVGGKSLHLAELAGPAARIDAVDRSATKLGHGREAARRMGVDNVRTIVADLAAADLPELAAAYDLVLLDAPCSGLGVLRRHPEATRRLHEPDVARLAAVQATLLDRLAPRVRPGGSLVFSVCTFTAAETDVQVDAFVRRHPEFAVELRERTWPHVDAADAFYLARLRRTGGP